ncbi:hypothetical protein [Phycicoccus sp. Soil803]|uniref:hypothetical protein n=1 Tax=Phycicoccus sp. Soil803 TaxID=1736415 RepID=UPI000A5103E0|nr:hypothetical protein [Phycicoccus sp. Soil803]
MSLRQPYAMHRQQVWKERAGSPVLPAWVRVAALAYGGHGLNGHADFSPGEIASVLGMDRKTGEVATPMARQNVHRAIRTAIDYGWLAEGSSATCLVVPSHAIWGGDLRKGRETKPCSAHRPGARPLKVPSMPKIPTDQGCGDNA